MILLNLLKNYKQKHTNSAKNYILANKGKSTNYICFVLMMACETSLVKRTTRMTIQGHQKPFDIKQQFKNLKPNYCKQTEAN